MLCSWSCLLEGGHLLFRCLRFPKGFSDRPVPRPRLQSRVGWHVGKTRVRFGTESDAHRQQLQFGASSVRNHFVSDLGACRLFCSSAIAACPRFASILHFWMTLFAGPCCPLRRPGKEWRRPNFDRFDKPTGGEGKMASASLSLMRAAPVSPSSVALMAFI